MGQDFNKPQVSKKCCRCKQEKLLSEYWSNQSRKDGLQPACKACKSEEAVNRKRIKGPRTDTDRKRERRKRLKRKYGLSLMQYATLVVKSLGLCDICGTPTNDLHVDHDHATGLIRGMLCHNCNVGLGHFKDNVDLLTVAILYLEEHENRNKAA